MDNLEELVIRRISTPGVRLRSVRGRCHQVDMEEMAVCVGRLKEHREWTAGWLRRRRRPAWGGSLGRMRMLRVGEFT